MTNYKEVLNRNQFRASLEPQKRGVEKSLHPASAHTLPSFPSPSLSLSVVFFSQVFFLLGGWLILVRGACFQNILQMFLLLRHQAVKSLGSAILISFISGPGESEGYHKCIFNDRMQLHS